MKLTEILDIADRYCQLPDAISVDDKESNELLLKYVSLDEKMIPKLREMQQLLPEINNYLNQLGHSYEDRSSSDKIHNLLIKLREWENG